MTDSDPLPAAPTRSRLRPVLLALAVVLGLLVVARETGVIGLSLSAKRMQSNYRSTGMRSTNATPEQVRPRPEGTPFVDRGGLEIFAPRGLFTDIVLSLLPYHPGVTGHVELVYEAPSSYVPLWKTADMTFAVHGELDLARDGKPSVHSQYDFHLDGNWRAIGLLSGREFTSSIASAVGQDLAKAFAAEIGQMRKH